MHGRSLDTMALGASCGIIELYKLSRFLKGGAV